MTAFAHFPAKIRTPRIVDDFLYVTDIAPTLLELAGVEHPGTRYRERTVEPASGRSFVSLLDGSGVQGGDRVVGMELFGKRAIISGDWKLIHMPSPYGNGDWQLYNIREDISESRDLAAENPQRVMEMRALWDEYAEQNHVILPDRVSGY